MCGPASTGFRQLLKVGGRQDAVRAVLLLLPVTTAACTVEADEAWRVMLCRVRGGVSYREESTVI